MWSPYHGTQPGDPAKLGDAVVKIAAMQSPPKLFVAGGDALSVITPAIEERLREARANEMLSKCWSAAKSSTELPVERITKKKPPTRVLAGEGCSSSL